VFRVSGCPSVFLCVVIRVFGFGVLLDLCVPRFRIFELLFFAFGVSRICTGLHILHFTVYSLAAIKPIFCFGSGLGSPRGIQGNSMGVL